MSLKYEVKITVEDGYQFIEHFKYGKSHRKDSPAVLYSDCEIRWYRYSNLHRIDGPAVEYPHGVKEWWINGFLYTKKRYDIEIRNYKI